MSNRVEELESKVAELQAAVNGLTEELVETKERLRQIEDEAASDYPVTGPRGDAESADGEGEGEARDEGAKAGEGVEEDTEAESESESDSESDETDIIVA